MTHRSCLILLMTALLVPAVALGQSAKEQAERAKIAADAEEAMAAFLERDPSLKQELGGAAAYAVFPSVGKGGLGIGGARGTGHVVVGGRPVAKATLTQISIGFQAGGQKYAELILFETSAAVESFLSGRFEMAAQVSAVAAASGASANAKYANGVKVLTLPKGGLMYEASVGGQKFSIARY